MAQIMRLSWRALTWNDLLVALKVNVAVVLGEVAEIEFVRSEYEWIGYVAFLLSVDPPVRPRPTRATVSVEEARQGYPSLGMTGRAILVILVSYYYGVS